MGELSCSRSFITANLQHARERGFGHNVLPSLKANDRSKPHALWCVFRSVWENWLLFKVPLFLFEYLCSFCSKVDMRHRLTCSYFYLGTYFKTLAKLQCTKNTFIHFYFPLMPHCSAHWVKTDHLSFFQAWVDNMGVTGKLKLWSYSAWI